MTNSAAPFSTGLRHHYVEAEGGDALVPISIFYPGVPSPGAVPARYVDLFAPSVDEALTACLAHLNLVPTQIAQSIAHAKSFRMRSFPELDADQSQGPYPVVLYSPGGEAHRFTNVPLLEHIAAAGYVVVTIDHPAEASPIVHPTGEVVRADPAKVDFISLTVQRVKEVRRVLDFLFELVTTPEYKGLLDTDRIGMFGHSRGGYVSTLAQAEDARIKAVGNVDGFLYAYWMKDGSSGITRWPKETQRKLRESTAPFLRIRGRDDFEDAARHFEGDAKDFAGDVNFVILAGWSHQTFGSSPMFQKVKTTADLASFCSLGSEPHVLTLSRLVIEFFDLYLKGLETRTYLAEGIHPDANALVKLRLTNN